MGGFRGIKPCVRGVGWWGEYIKWFGFIRIALVALIGFMLIMIFMWLLKGEKCE